MSVRAKIIIGVLIILVVGFFLLLFRGLGGDLGGGVIPRSAL